jgi:hypothetical protein
MTTNNNDDQDNDIGVSLEQDPELLYWTWKVFAESSAANMATIVHPTGLLSVMLTDQEWNAYAANRTTSPHGTVTIAARPLAPIHEPIVAGMSTDAISVAKYNNERHLIWHDAVTALKKSVIRSLGPTLAGTIGPPPDGFKLKSLQDIVTDVRTKFGVVDQVALNRMAEILTSPLDHVANLNKHLATLRRHILMQTAAGYSIEEYRQVRIFRKSVGSHHQISQCLADYDRLNPDPLLHTYASVTAYVVTHLPNIRAAAELASSIPGRALSATAGSSSYETAKSHKDMTMQELQCAYSVLEYKHSTLQKRQKRTGGKGNKNGKRTKKDTDTPPRAEDCTHYCHAHGYQSSHTSAQCKVMASQTSNFSADMRRATNPNNPPGGSKLIRGRDPTVLGSKKYRLQVYG